MKRTSLSMKSSARQRGSIIVLAALALSAAVIMLSIADIGFMYFYKREYQKAADLAAMAGARSLVAADGSRSCVNNATPAATTNAARNLGAKNYTIIIECGQWVPNASVPSARLNLLADADQVNAVRAVVSGAPPRFLPFIEPPVISARAIAVAQEAMARLTIRGTLATVNTEQSALLNTIVGGLLGGAINLPVAAWDGLLNTNINLLRYLDALAVELGISAGRYDQVLGADVTLGQLLGVAADVLTQGGGTGQVGAAVGGLDTLSVLNLPAFTPLLRLGDLLDVQTGTPAAALDLGLNLLDLVQGSVQLANSECAVCASLPINLPGVAGVNVRVGVTEPPKLSSIGNPALAELDPLGEDRIYVRTAQVRALISIDLPLVGSVLSGVEALLNSSVVSGITNAVNDLLSLNLLGLLEGLGCVVYCDIQRDVIDIRVLPSPRLDVNLDAGSGEAYVNEHDCSATKELRVPTNTATAHLRIGKMGNSAADAAARVFSSSAPPTLEPIPILDIGTKRVRYQCTILLICWTEWQNASGGWTGNANQARRNAFAGGGIGLKADLPVAGVNTTLTYNDPPANGLPDLSLEPAHQSVNSTNIVNSLRSTLTGLQLQFYRPSGSAIGGNGLGNLLFVVGNVVNTLVSTVTALVSGVLSPLLDPLLNLLVSGLGINLNRIDVGANLSCDGGGATLVD